MNKNAVILMSFFLLIIVVIIGFYKFILYKEKLDYETINYDYQSKCVKEVYKIHPSAFSFDSENICKITVEQIHTISDDYSFEIEHDKNGNMCLGYFVIRKVDNDIEIDSSHICDMINY